MTSILEMLATYAQAREAIAQVESELSDLLDKCSDKMPSELGNLLQRARFFAKIGFLPEIDIQEILRALPPGHCK